MEKCYTEQPSTLPAKLPKGTRTLAGSKAASELHLVIASYVGDWNRGENMVFCGAISARDINWSSVPKPSEPEGDLCECCGVAKATHTLGGARVADSCVSSKRSRILNDILARRAAQASADCRRCGCVPCECDNPVRPAGLAERHCPECGVTVVAGPQVEFPLCAKCVERRAPMLKATRPDPRMVQRDDAKPGMTPGARARLAAWSRAERPRGNPAERKMLAAGHPVSWPSCEGEE